MSDFLFFQKISTIQKDSHAKTRIEPITDYLFTEKVNSVMLTCAEFPIAVREYPIVFIANKESGFIPAAMLGTGNRNSFVNKKGRWLGKYIPLYIRQYPFIAAKDPKNKQAVICMDEQYKGINQSSGQPLFKPDGQKSKWFQQAISPALLYLDNMEKTIVFGREISKLDILTQLDPRLENRKTGKTTIIEGLWAVDENRLNSLGDEQVLKLYRQGYLAWIYLHLASLSNFPTLANKGK